MHFGGGVVYNTLLPSGYAIAYMDTYIYFSHNLLFHIEPNSNKTNWFLYFSSSQNNIIGVVVATYYCVSLVLVHYIINPNVYVYDVYYSSKSVKRVFVFCSIHVTNT